MHIVAVAWIFVVVLMALVEATSTQGTVLGAFFTLLLYGALPLSIVLYVMGTPMRRRKLRAAEARSTMDDPGVVSGHSNGSGQPPADGLAPERKEP